MELGVKTEDGNELVTEGIVWRYKFDEQQLKEIDFCLLYAKDFRHGTDGHNGKLIIAKLAMLLDEAENHDA